MNQDMIRKLMVFGMFFLFLALIVQPSLSKELPIDKKIESNVVSDSSEPEKECNCIDASKSGRPICDLIHQMMLQNDIKLDEAAVLLEEYKNYPIRCRIAICYALVLLTKDVILIQLWFLLGCSNDF